MIDEYNQWRTITYLYPEGAFRQVGIELKHAYYRIKARTVLVPAVNMRTLNAKETTFVNKLIKNNCVGISAKMYGYLVGIWERNKKN